MRVLSRFLAVSLLALGLTPVAGAVEHPDRFQEIPAITGLLNPTAVRFAANGQVFVAENSGMVYVYDGIGDSTPTTVVDLRTDVHNFWDRGLLGLGLSTDGTVPRLKDALRGELGPLLEAWRRRHAESVRGSEGV